MRLPSVSAVPMRRLERPVSPVQTSAHTLPPAPSSTTALEPASAAPQELDVAAAQGAATAQRLAVLGSSSPPVKYTPTLPLEHPDRYRELNERNNALHQKLLALGPEGIEQLPKTSDGFPIPPGMDENFWTAYHPEQGFGTSWFSNCTPDDRKMVYMATGVMVTPDGTCLGGSGDPTAADLVFHVADGRVNGFGGLDATGPMSAQWLKDLFEKYAAENVRPGVTPLNPKHLDRALEYIATGSVKVNWPRRVEVSRPHPTR